MKFLRRLVCITAAAAVLQSCGTVSDVNLTGAQVSKPPGGYSKVLVEDFTSSPVAPVANVKVAQAEKTLPETIAGEIRELGKFSQVSRTGKPDASTLIIKGNIDQYDDGNAVMRAVVGFAAGNSNLDATVTYIDGKSGKSLGSLKADKNSWAMGGLLAAAQTADSFIEPIAKKIAKEATEKFSQ